MDPLSLLMIVAAGAAFYFLSSARASSASSSSSRCCPRCSPGAEIMTTAGIFGTIAVVTDEQISLEVVAGRVPAILPAAVSRVIEPAAPAEPEADAAVRETPDAEPPVD